MYLALANISCEFPMMGTSLNCWCQDIEHRSVRFSVFADSLVRRIPKDLGICSMGDQLKRARSLKSVSYESNSRIPNIVQHLFQPID